MSLEGEIHEIDLIARLVDLGRDHFTGAIRFESDGIIKIVYFKTGDVLSASTNDRTDSIDEILLRAGKVTREHIKQALAKRKESETLGDALLGLGFITRKELTWARRVQVIGILRSVNAWSNGSFTIVDDYLPKRDEGTVFALPQIILELIVTDPDRERFERALDGGYAVLAKSAEFDERFRTLGLNQDADDIVSAIDGSRTATEIAAASGKDEFNTWKLLRALEMLGLLSRVAPRSPEDELPFDTSGDELAAAGVADAANVWDEPPSATWDVPTEQFAITDEPVPATVEMPMVASAVPTETHDMPAWSAEPERPPMREVVAKAAKPNRGIGILLGAIALIILTFAGWAGWNWWQGKPTIAPAARKPIRSAGFKPAGPPASLPARRPITTVTPPATPAQVATAAPTATTTTAVAPAGSQRTGQPEAGAPNDPLRAKYDTMAHHYQATAAGGAYTIQFELVCQTSSLTRALAGNNEKVWFVPTSYGGKSCYRVLWGQYATRDAAANAISEIPAALRGGGNPVVIATPK